MAQSVERKMNETSPVSQKWGEHLCSTPWGQTDLDDIIGDDDDEPPRPLSEILVKRIDALSCNDIPVQSPNTLPILAEDDEEEDVDESFRRVRGSSVDRKSPLNTSIDDIEALNLATPKRMSKSLLRILQARDRTRQNKDGKRNGRRPRMKRNSNDSYEHGVSEHTESTCSISDELSHTSGEAALRSLSSCRCESTGSLKGKETRAKSKSPGSLKNMFRKVKPVVPDGVVELPRL